MKTAYYKVKSEVDSKIIGRRYPQITGSTGGYWDISDPKSAYGQLGAWTTPSGPPPVGQLNLTKGAKRTDILSASMFSHCGFIMSSMAKAVFEKYEIGNNWFFPVDILHKEETLNYFILHTNNDYIDEIDWNKTTFSLSTWVLDKGQHEIKEIIKIDNKEHLFYLRDNKEARNNMYLKAHQLILLPRFDSSQDMIAFYRIALGKLVSERLKTALENEGVSGIRFERTEEFDEWLNT